jgi:hypothetical protein
MKQKVMEMSAEQALSQLEFIEQSHIELGYVTTRQKRNLKKIASVLILFGYFTSANIALSLL